MIKKERMKKKRKLRRRMVLVKEETYLGRRGSCGCGGSRGETEKHKARVPAPTERIMNVNDEIKQPV